MRVKDCQGCRHCSRRVWSSSYKPANYHAIGVSHAYHYCEYHKDRCLNVRVCNDYEEESPDGGAYSAHLDCYG